MRAGDAVLIADGAAALLIGVEGGEALLRVGTLADTPFQLPVELVSKVADETERHDRFRVEATLCGELSA